MAETVLLILYLFGVFLVINSVLLAVVWILFLNVGLLEGPRVGHWVDKLIFVKRPALAPSEQAAERNGHTAEEKLRHWKEKLTDILLVGPILSPTRATLILAFVLLVLISVAIEMAGASMSIQRDPGTILHLMRFPLYLLTAFAAAFAAFSTVKDRGIEPRERVAKRLFVVAMLPLVAAFGVGGLPRGSTLAQETATAITSATVFTLLILGVCYTAAVQGRYAGKVMRYKDYVSLPRRKRVVFFLWRMAQSGWVPLAYNIAKLVVSNPTSKYEFELRTVLAYHRNRYRESLDLVNEYLKKRENEESDILESYRCQSIARLESLDKAISELNYALARKPNNCYYRSVLAYLLWQAGKVDDALKTGIEALKAYYHDKGYACAHMATHLSLFCSERALDLRTKKRPVDELLVKSSLVFACAAAIRLRSPNVIFWGDGIGDLVHNLGLGCLLLSDVVEEEERDELLSFAARAFARSVWLESHAASRFRLALFHMIASRRYKWAEYQLNRILSSQWNRPPMNGTRFPCLVERSRERIFEARKAPEKIRYSREILFLHTAEKIVLEEAFLKNSWKEERRRMHKWIALNPLHPFQLTENPFERLPARVKEVKRELDNDKDGKFLKKSLEELEEYVNKPASTHL